MQMIRTFKTTDILSFYFCFCLEELEAGCLYTKDYEAKEADKWNSLWNFVQPYINRIGCCQHPHAWVLRDLLFANKEVSVVTEEYGTRVIYIVDGVDRE